MKSNSWIALVGIGMALWLAACSGRGAQTQPAAGPNVEKPPVPAEYAGKTNPMSNDSATVETGKELYQTNCAACHGETGMGDGPAANSLNPPPRALATEMNQIGDDYLLWRISEGGAMEPFHSAMPAWKNILSLDKIWQIITFLRSLS